MCFSNLPIEFDEEGDPYLAEEADDVSRPASTSGDAQACGCAGADAPEATTLDEADPESVYEAILETVPSDVREQIDGSGRHGHRDRPKRGRTDREP